ncbi:MAG: helix-turn-helix domain-containing protein [Firmicutes bacterium]|nr:helix-turn-helix domain-containing protein [Bacillota bacterium]
MAAKKVGALIKEARTAAGLSQAALAELVEGVSASDISKAERGEKELSAAALKAIAKATGVTQKSLLEAAKGSGASSGKTSSGKTSAGKTEVKLTAEEKSLLSAYRKADEATCKAALQLLKGQKDLSDNVLGDLLANAMGMLGNLGKK